MKTATRLRPPFKCHGGKAYLAPWVVSHLPAGHEEMTYLEPFCGGGSVMLNKSPARAEALNDIDPSVFDIFRALRDTPDEFVERLREVPYAEDTFLRAVGAGRTGDDLGRAVHEYPRRRMRRGGLYDRPDTLVYADPPYLPSTRVSKQAYRAEMDYEDHLELAVTLRRFKGPVALSGYPSALYDSLYEGWRRVEKSVANHSSQAKTKEVKVEVLWMNY